MKKQKNSREAAKPRRKEEKQMPKSSQPLRIFAASRETQKEGDGKSTLVPKLRFPEFREKSHAKARSSEEEGGGI
jgi:hypothetical protein